MSNVELNVTKHGYHIMSAKLYDSAVCNSVINFIEDNILEFKLVNDNYSKAYCVFPSHYAGARNKEYDKIDDLIFKGVSAAIIAFIDKNIRKPGTLLNNDIGDSGYELRKIIGATDEHQDGLSISHTTKKVQYRVATLVISLSDTGDSLVFPEFDIEIPLREGTVVFFPPYWTHRHYSKWSGKEGYRIQTWLTNAVKH